MTVLAYHGIGLDCRSRNVVCARRFESHVAYLERNGYVGLTLAQAEDRLAAGTAPKKWVAVTFDDGLASVERTVPILQRAGFPATVFVVTRYVDSGRTPDWPLIEQVASPDPSDMTPLSWADLRWLAGLGWEIGSHTVDHRYLAAMSDEDLLRELTESRRRILDEIGSCVSLAYPYGLADPRVMEAAAKAGYSAACTLASVYAMDERLARPRIGIGARDRRLRFRVKLSRRAIAVRRSRAVHVAQNVRAHVSRADFVDDRLLRELFAAKDSTSAHPVDTPGSGARATAVVQD